MTETRSPDVLERPDRPLRLAALGLGVFALIAIALAWNAYTGQVDRAVNDAQLRARGAAADVDRYVQSKWWTLEAIATVPAMHSGDRGQMRAYLDGVDAARLGLDAGLGFVDSTGFLQARADYAGPPMDFRDRAHILQALQTGQPVVSSVLTGAINSQPIVAFNVPVFDQQGQLLGLIASGVRLGSLSIGADALRYVGGTNVVIIDRDGGIVAGPQPVDVPTSASPAFGLGAAQAAREGSSTSATGPFGDGDQLLAWSTAGTAGWLVLVQAPADVVLGPARATLGAQVGAILLLTLLGVALLWWAGTRLRRAVESERRMLDDLRNAVAILERRQALSDTFVGVMSHELRTPVTTIYGAVKVLSGPNGMAHLHEMLPDIEEEAERLQRITEDLLVLSRAEHGRVEIRPEPVLIQRLLPHVIADVARRYPGGRFETALSPDLPAAAGEDIPLRQVLGNLLTNAAKYGGGAPATVSARVEDGWLRIDVADSGPGVEPGEHERLFEVFYRSPSSARRAAGTGIGLFVVRELVQAMGGTVTAEPVTPHGIRFVIRLRIVGPELADEVEADALAAAAGVAAEVDQASGQGPGPRPAVPAGTS